VPQVRQRVGAPGRVELPTNGLGIYQSALISRT
jgi:hypothetical protein